MSKLAILITGHYCASKRKAGFHWIAESLWQQNWKVFFVTCSISWQSVLRRDYRLDYPVLKEANQLIEVRPSFWSYVWFTPWHPTNLRFDWLRKAAAPLLSQYGNYPLGELEAQVHLADLFVFESTPGLMLFDRFKRAQS